MPQRLKLFISLQPSWSWVSSLEWTQHDLQARGLADLEWIARERLHMTLVPLGEVDRRHVAEIIKAMTQAAEDCEPFELQAGTLDLFGQPRKPTVLWAGVRGETVQLDQLWQTLQISIRTLHFSLIHSRFQPHITIAHVPHDLRDGIANCLRGVVARTTLPESDHYLVQRIYLIHSTGESGHLRHRPIASAVLGMSEKGC